MLEVLELEPDVEEESSVEREAVDAVKESPSQVAGDVSEPQTPNLESGGSELCKPKMKIFHGKMAPGLRIRSAPTFMVLSLKLCVNGDIIIILSLSKAEQLAVITPGDCFSYSEEVSSSFCLSPNLDMHSSYCKQLH